MFIASCNEQNEQPKVASGDSYFGHFYEYCVGETCTEIFNLTSTNLYEDTNDDYPRRDKPYEGNFKRLTDAQFEKVKHLSTTIPGELLVENDTIIGTPDAGDWGGVYFVVNTVEEPGFG